MGGRGRGVEFGDYEDSEWRQLAAYLNDFKNSVLYQYEIRKNK